LDIVIYDADCGICTKAVGKLRLWVPNGFVAKPSSQDLTRKIAELTGTPIQPDKYMYHINLNNLEIARGYDAFRKIFSLNRRTYWLYVVMSFPLLKVVGRLVYRVVAQNRRRLSGPDARCGL